MGERMASGLGSGLSHGVKGRGEKINKKAK